MNADQPQEAGQESRSSASWLLLLLLASAAIGAVTMIWLGSSALDMSGRGMELNKLLDKKNKICADRARLDECEKILGQIQTLEREMAGEKDLMEKGGGQPAAADKL